MVEVVCSVFVIDSLDILTARLFCFLTGGAGLCGVSCPNAGLRAGAFTI